MLTGGANPGVVCRLASVFLSVCYRSLVLREVVPTACTPIVSTVPGGSSTRCTRTGREAEPGVKVLLRYNRDLSDRLGEGWDTGPDVGTEAGGDAVLVRASTN